MRYIVVINGVDSPLAIVIPSTATDGSNLVDSIAVAQGDLIGIALDKDAVISPGVVDVSFSLEFA